MPIAGTPACEGAIACSSPPPCSCCDCLGVAELTSMGAEGVPVPLPHWGCGSAAAWAAVAGLAWTTVAILGDCTTVANVGRFPAETSFATLGGGAGTSTALAAALARASATPRTRTFTCALSSVGATSCGSSSTPSSLSPSNMENECRMRMPKNAAGERLKTRPWKPTYMPTCNRLRQT